MTTGFSKHPFLALTMFCCAYFVTVNVSARAQDAVVSGQSDTIQLQEGRGALITGQIVAVGDRSFDMTSNGRTMRVSLHDVGLNAPADSVFTPGMRVAVNGEMRGEEFDRTLVRAKNVVASVGPTATASYINAPTTIYRGSY